MAAVAADHRLITLCSADFSVCSGVCALQHFGGQTSSNDI